MKEIGKIYLKDYDVYVNPYLTYAQIQTIANSVKTMGSWAERQQNIDMLVLVHATDMANIDMLVLAFGTSLGTDTIEAKEHEYWLNTGLIDEVKKNIINFGDIQSAITYEESIIKLLKTISQEIPEFNKKVDEVMKNASGSSKE